MVGLMDTASPLMQLRNLGGRAAGENRDRLLLILRYFALRAKSATLRTCVELAQYQYLLAPPNRPLDSPRQAARRRAMKGLARNGNRD
jgi:50S ribosomal subunit-associated GTPase HflX